MHFVLVGQPNCGKSTIFNSVVGYKSVTSNLPGATVEYTIGELNINNNRIPVIDIPGTYSLITTDDSELEAVRFLLNRPKDSVIINIIDASVLSRSLELTLQLMELKKPMVVVLNMMDEAERKGLEISIDKLSKILGIPVIPSIGTKGKGVVDIFNQAYEAGINNIIPNQIPGPAHLEDIILNIETILKKNKLKNTWNERFIAIKLLEHDKDVIKSVKSKIKKLDWEKIKSSIMGFEKKEKEDTHILVSSFRHNTAFEIFENSSRIERKHKVDIRIRIDNILMHPIFGYLFMVAILYSTFLSIYATAELIEPFVTGTFESLIQIGIQNIGIESWLFPIYKGFMEGFGGGIAIAVPYLIPFFIILSLLEDTGYLARIAYLMDNLMHKIGLHGMSVVPMILGYGCTVPAILATRILKSRRDKLITATLATLVPCSARMVVILGLVGAVFSLKAALMIYIINTVILGLTGKIMSKIMPEVTPGLLMEIPRYHMPAAKVVFSKTWLRLKEFVYLAWPLLIVGSIVLELIGHFNLTEYINNGISFFTVDLLGLPAVVGVVLLFGIMRKELALLLLTSALAVQNTGQILNVMTPAQVYSFTIFVTFYIPCLATIAALAKEFNWFKAIGISFLTFVIAIGLTLGVRFIFPFIA